MSHIASVVITVNVDAPACTGYIARDGHVSHDGDTCPVHESQPLPSEQHDARKRLRILDAVTTGERMTFIYRDRDGVRSHRHATPYAIERCANDSTIVRCFDHDRQAPRSFTLDNIVHVRSI